MSIDEPVYRFTNAIVRRPSKSVVKGLRADDRGDPSYADLCAEHDAYLEAMQAAGVSLTVLPALEAFPDSIFVEDPARVFTEGAVLLRPGAPSRAGEAKEIAPVLQEAFETVLEMPASGYADGGDILTTASKVMIGLSSRTDLAGAKALAECLATLGRASEIVETPEGVLHFKTDCSLLDEETVFSTERLARSGVFEGFDIVTVPECEEAAANALRVNDVILIGADFPRSIDLLDGLGFKVLPLKTTQIGLIDAGLSCMSLRWRRV